MIGDFYESIEGKIMKLKEDRFYMLTNKCINFIFLILNTLLVAND